MSGRQSRGARPAQGPAAGSSARRRRWLWPALAFVLVAVLVGGTLIARANRGPAEATKAASAGKEISFAGTDPVSGERVDLAAYAGKPVVVNVWGSWCPGCNAEAADLRRFGAAHPDIQVVGVDLQDSKSGARGFYRRWGWRHPSVFDPDGRIAFSLGLQGTPTTYFLDRNHRLVTQIVGETNLAGFERGLQAALES